MFQNIITVFNYHKASGKWYPSVISGADLIADKASTHTVDGLNNADTAAILIQSCPCRNIITSMGPKQYVGPKEYAACGNPAEVITFKPECDFIYDGVWPDLTPVTEDDYDEGFYHAVNDGHDGVYMISSAAYFSVIPHFEIGGR